MPDGSRVSNEDGAVRVQVNVGRVYQVELTSSGRKIKRWFFEPMARESQNHGLGYKKKADAVKACVEHWESWFTAPEWFLARQEAI